MRYTEIREIARRLRSNPTPSEVLLWKNIRKRKLNNARFNRQYPLIYESKNNDFYFYVPDFYCHEHKLVIELDGKIHEFQKKRDWKRDMIIEDMGLTVLRIKNEELKNMDQVLDKIKRYLS